MESRWKFYRALDSIGVHHVYQRQPAKHLYFLAHAKDAAAFDDSAFQFLETFGFKLSGEHQWTLHDNTIT